MLERLVERLKLKLAEAAITPTFQLLRVVHNAHVLPLTNCAFNKSGDKFITGSYDRTCKVFDTKSGSELRVLEGHKNVVFAVAFNNPFGDKILTGSFDKTAKLWDAASGTFTLNRCKQNTKIYRLAHTSHNFDTAVLVLQYSSPNKLFSLWHKVPSSSMAFGLASAVQVLPITLNFQVPQEAHALYILDQFFCCFAIYPLCRTHGAMVLLKSRHSESFVLYYDPVICRQTLAHSGRPHT
jgi:hypothetical protein